MFVPSLLSNGNLDHAEECSSHTITTLENDLSGVAAQSTLKAWHGARIRLRCRCGVILHVVSRRDYFLRRNPLQPSLGVTCRLCAPKVGGAVTPTPAAPPEIGLILAIREQRSSRSATSLSDHRSSHRQTRHVSGGVRSASAHAHLVEVCVQAGFTRFDPEGTVVRPDMQCLAGPFAWNELWRRVHQELANIRLWTDDVGSGVTRASMADFAWLPGGSHAGGLHELGERLRRGWRRSGYAAEGTLWTIVDEAPGDVIRFSRSMSAETIHDEDAFEIVVPPPVRSRVGKTHPYLALAAVSVDKNTSHAAPRIRRMVFHSIAARHFPVLVDSRHERDVVMLLGSRGIAFGKPAVATSDRLHPDFLLPRHRLLIEVQGMNSAGYRERKAAIHARLRQSKRFHGWELITYELNRGEKLAAFASRLDALLYDRERDSRRGGGKLAAEGVERSWRRHIPDATSVIEDARAAHDG